MARTDTGLVRGVDSGAVREYNGIPYARPPVGKLRWVVPRPAAAWPGVRDAREPGPRCAQGAGPGAQVSYAEDCLYLNVTTPRGGARHKPVMVWLHGGGFTAGAGSDYDPTRLAAQGDVVVVTVNYRLGTFGFLSHPELGRAGGDFGLQDQVAALRWVRRNARAFGGDPGDVTLFGESAGAFSTCALLAAPSAAGLIDKAIVESGTCSVYFPKNVVAPGLAEHHLLTPLASSEPVGTDLARTSRACAGSPRRPSWTTGRSTRSPNPATAPASCPTIPPATPAAYR